MGEERKLSKVGEARRKETTRKTKGSWEDGIKMDLREIGLGVLI
jgi:hypothetical protein